MHIITVTPIAKGIFREELSYFSTKTIYPGAIVTVPVKNKLTEALVLQTELAATNKAELKSSDFSLRKVHSVVSPGLFLPSFLATARQIATYSNATVGQIIKSVTPQVILENLSELKNTNNSAEPKEPALAGNTIHYTRFALQEPDEERLAFYKSLIREEFAKQHSIFFCLPSASDIDRVIQSLGKGIADYTVTLHPGKTKKDILADWQKALSTDHPILIIGTPLFLSLPRADLKMFIIDKENSSHYKTIGRPHFDPRTFIECFAKSLDAKCIIGDTVLRSETIYRVGAGELTPASPLKYRSFSEAKQALIDHTRKEGDGPWQAIHPDLAGIITKAQANNERTIIFTGRRGIAPTTICRDCGTLVTCPQCSSPLVVHRKRKKDPETANTPTIFMCHHCQTVEETRALCSHCGSWHLVSFGAGIEKVTDDIKAIAPEATIITIESDTVKTAKKAAQLMDAFMAAPGSILIGTEMIIGQLNEKVENIVAVSLDSLLMIPDFRIKEKLFATLTRLRSYATKSFSIQTKHITDPVFDYILKGNLLDFYRDELDERKKFKYPPFCRLIKISREGAKEEVMADMEKLDQLLADYEPLIFPAFMAVVKGQYRMHALLKVASDRWQPHAVDEALAATLRRLPPNYDVEVDPEDIL